MPPSPQEQEQQEIIEEAKKEKRQKGNWFTEMPMFAKILIGIIILITFQYVRTTGKSNTAYIYIGIILIIIFLFLRAPKTQTKMISPKEAKILGRARVEEIIKDPNDHELETGDKYVLRDCAYPQIINDKFRMYCIGLDVYSPTRGVEYKVVKIDCYNRDIVTIHNVLAPYYGWQTQPVQYLFQRELNIMKQDSGLARVLGKVFR